MTWKFVKGEKKPFKGDDTMWYVMGWIQGNDEIEIVQYFDDDKGKYGDFEVWHQIKNKEGDSWDGENIATFKSKVKAIAYAKKTIKNW